MQSKCSSVVFVSREKTRKLQLNPFFVKSPSLFLLLCKLWISLVWFSISESFNLFSSLRTKNVNMIVKKITARKKRNYRNAALSAYVCETVVRSWRAILNWTHWGNKKDNVLVTFVRLLRSYGNLKNDLKHGVYINILR